MCKTSKRNKMISEANYWDFHLEENSMVYLEVWGSHCTGYHICLAIFITRWYSSCPRESTCPVAESDHLRTKREGIKLFILQLEGRNLLYLLSAEVRVFCFTFLLCKAVCEVAERIFSNMVHVYMGIAELGRKNKAVEWKHAVHTTDNFLMDSALFSYDVILLVT